MKLTVVLAHKSKKPSAVSTLQCVINHWCYYKLSTRCIINRRCLTTHYVTRLKQNITVFLFYNEWRAESIVIPNVVKQTSPYESFLGESH